MLKLVFATHNQNKLAEIQSLLGTSFHLISLTDLGYEEEIPEPHLTLEENAMHKACTIFDRFNIPCFADDTGLETEALSGAPGVFSARYSGLDSGSEHNRSDSNIEKLLNNLKGIVNRKAQFRTVIAFKTENMELLFEGIVTGQIAEHKKGNKGFGYDPVFIPDGFEITFAEMSMSEKNNISHRAIAFKKFSQFLKTNISA